MKTECGIKWAEIYKSDKEQTVDLIDGILLASLMEIATNTISDL